ncbi:MAG: ATP-binding protein [Clostridia bacterium]|nr:ATP-binding protein [Clostridia bacterium]
MDKNIINSPQNEIIGDLVVDIPSVQASSNGKALYDLFESEPQAEGAVILDGENLVGLVMKNNFLKKMANKFGYSIYMGRPVTLFTDVSPMVVDFYTEITKVGICAMNRTKENLYDFILVSKNNKYVGAVGISPLLIELSRRSEEKLEILKAQHEELKKANEQEIELTKTICEKNKLLEIKSNSIKNLLDNAGQGFLSFGRDCVIEDDYSMECINILGKDIKNMNYLDLIHTLFMPEKAEVFAAALRSYFQSESKLKDNAYLNLMPKEVKVGFKTVHFEYKRIEFAGEKKIMVILTDVSQRVAMERAMEEERKNQHLIVNALTNMGEVNRMFKELSDFFDSCKSTILDNAEDALDEIFRCVHTFKGDFAQFGLHNSSKRLHALEDELQNLKDEKISSNRLAAWVDKVDTEKIISEDKEVITNILGEDFLNRSEQIKISANDLNNIKRVVANTCNDEQKRKIMPLLNKLKCRNLKEVMVQYTDYIDYISQRLGKETPTFEVCGDDVWIEKEAYGDVLKTMVHLFRNMCDHGIECAEERVLAGKPEEGNIVCEISKSDNFIFMKLSDDGKGIDCEQIRKKAIDKKILPEDKLSAMSEKELINLIFTPHLSTKSGVSCLSGRGVGMTAVKEALEKINGSIAVESCFGKGTSYLISIPIFE